MQLATTFRALERAEVKTATRALERSMGRLERLAEEPATLRAVVEGGPPECKVTLVLAYRDVELTAQSSGHEVVSAVHIAAERLRVQLNRRSERRQSQRYRSAVKIEAA
ncbi:MAG: hypothetical protein IT371_09170 [Deltaproteobacteria bacterium]|nr:hypothetical protein [Deltaproteobacteria bacterium]